METCLHGQIKHWRWQQQRHLAEEQNGLNSCAGSSLPKELQQLLQKFPLQALRNKEKSSGLAEVPQHENYHGLISQLRCKEAL